MLDAVARRTSMEYSPVAVVSSLAEEFNILVFPSLDIDALEYTPDTADPSNTSDGVAHVKSSSG